MAAYRYRLFISHARDDAAWVKSYLTPALGLDPSCIITQDTLPPGASRLDAVEQAVIASAYTLLIVTPAYLSDGWSGLGEQFAGFLAVEDQQERLIPLQLKPADIPLRIQSRVSLDCTDEANWETEVERLRDLLHAAPPGPDEIPCPYPGIASFDQNNAAFFFGRENEIEWMVQHFRHHRFLLVVGPSGSGKSSLVKAGFLPAVNKSDFFRANPWLIRTMRPAKDPRASLNEALAGDSADPSAAVSALLATAQPGARLLLSIDQLEEVFHSPQQKDFLSALQALRKDPQCALVACLRADFYGELMSSALWPVDQAQQLNVAPLNEDEMRRAIEQPAWKAGQVAIEGRLVDQLVADAAGEPGALPLLQETLVTIWSKRKRRFLPFSAYESLRTDGRSGLAAAISSSADATFLSLADADQQAIARRIFLRLVQFGEGRADTRRQQNIDELRAESDDPVQFDLVLHSLADGRLLSMSGAEDTTTPDTVDIAHEALLNGWPRLADWIKQWRDAERKRRDFESKATEWSEAGRGQRGLLDAFELEEVERWLKEPVARDVGFSKQLLDCVAASRAAVERARAERRAARQRFVALLSAAGILMLVVAVAFALRESFNAQQQGQKRQEAEAASTAAVEAQNTAVASKLLAQENESLAWTELARQQLTVDPLASLYWSRQALPAPDVSRPYVASAEYALREALNASLELAEVAGPNPVEARQVALDGPQLALGKDRIQLISPDLSNFRSVEMPVVAGVTWQGDALLAYGANDAQVLQADQQLAQRFEGAISSALWRPKRDEVGVTAGRDVYRWQPGGDPELIHSSKAVYSDWRGFPPLAWAADGSSLAAWNTGRELFAWREQGKQTFVITDTTSLGDEIWQAAWSPDGSTLAAVMTGNSLAVWPMSSNPQVVTHTLDITSDEAVGGVEFVDARTFYTWGGGKVQLWSLDNLTKPMETHDFKAGPIYGVQLRPEDGLLLVFMQQGDVWLWDLKNDQFERYRGHQQAAQTAAWYGEYFATGAMDGTVRVWRRGQEESLAALPGVNMQSPVAHGEVMSVRWNADGTLVSAGSDGLVRLWSVFDEHEMPYCTGRDAANNLFYCYRNTKALVGHSANIVAGQWLDDDTALSVDEDGIVRRWTISNGSSVELKNPGPGRWTTALAPDGSKLFTFEHRRPDQPPAERGLTRSVPAGETLRTVEGPITSARWLGSNLLIEDDKGRYRLLNSADGSTALELPADQKQINDAAISGEKLATVDEEGWVRVWDLAQGGPPKKWRQNEGPVYYAAWDHEGQQLAGAGPTVAVWDGAGEQPTWRYPLSGIRSGQPDFSTDGALLAGSEETRVMVWDAKSKEVLWSSPPAAEVVRSVEWLDAKPFEGAAGAPATRKLLLSLSADTVARLWDYDSKTQIMRLAEPGAVQIAAVSPSGSYILTGGRDGALRVWNAWLNRPEELLRVAREHTDRWIH